VGINQGKKVASMSLLSREGESAIGKWGLGRDSGRSWCHTPASTPHPASKTTLEPGPDPKGSSQRSQTETRNPQLAGRQWLTPVILTT
jgi:hypothetical protein